MNVESWNTDFDAGRELAAAAIASVAADPNYADDRAGALADVLEDEFDLAAQISTAARTGFIVGLAQAIAA